MWIALDDVVHAAQFSPTSVIVVHGDCPTGADQDALWWAMDRGAKNDPHPADWGKHGKRAGFRRNAAMVRLGADICLAFSRVCTNERCPRVDVHGSHGTAHCMGLAKSAHIPVLEFREGW